MTLQARDAGGRRAAGMPFILVAVLIDMIAIGLMIPVLPAWVGSFTASASEQAFAYGLVAFAFGIASFFGGPVLGALSDRFGRRPVLLLGFGAMAASFFVTAAATALWMLVAVRLFSGAMQANVAVAQAYVADITPAGDARARRFGLLGAMLGVGYTLGPVLGGVLGAVDLRLPFVVAGVLALVNTAYGALVLPESLPPDRRQPFRWRRANPVGALRALGALRGVGPMVWVIALSALAQFTLHISWVLHNTYKFGWGPKENGWSLFAVGVAMAVVQGGLMKPLLRRFGPQRLAQIGLVSATLAYLGWGLATAPWMMFAIIALNVFGFAAAASIQSLVSGAAGEHEQGRTMGSVASLNSLMGVAAPVVAAGLLGLVAELPRGDIRIGLPLVFCALLQGGAALIALRHFRGHRDVPAAAPTAPESTRAV